MAERHRPFAAALADAHDQSRAWDRQLERLIADHAEFRQRLKAVDRKAASNREDAR